MKTYKQLSERVDSKVWIASTAKGFHKNVSDLFISEGREAMNEVWQCFKVVLVPVEDQEIRTAACPNLIDGPEDLIIYVNKGFCVHPVRDALIFKQMSVVIRHELGHFLFKHYIRSVDYFSKKLNDQLITSPSFAELENILADFEDNRKISTTSSDKARIRELYLNGETIHGLLVEEHRLSWEKMSLEEMYDAFAKELEESQGNLLKLSEEQMSSPTLLKAMFNVSKYKELAKKFGSTFNSIDELYSKIFPNGYEVDSSADPRVQKRSKTIISNYLAVKNAFEKIMVPHIDDYSEDELVEMKDQIAKSHPYDAVQLVDVKTGKPMVTVGSPEIKMVAVEILNIFLNKYAYDHDFRTWYKELTDLIASGEYSDDEIKDFLDTLKETK